MAGHCRIVADVFERESAVVSALRSRGARVDLAALPAGDYALPADALVERKTVIDLHLSIRQGRLWRQIGSIRHACRLPYLLVEGPSIDAGPLGSEAIRGACLAVIGQGVPVLRSVDAQDSARWLHLLALRTGGQRPGRDRPAYAQRLKPEPALVPEAMLGAVPGISVKTARELLSRFGSVEGVLAAGHDAWLAVPGIGRSRAGALRDALF